MRQVIVTRFVKGLHSVGTAGWRVMFGLMLAFPAPGFADREVTLAWGANSEPILGGYRLYYGTAHRNYTSVIEVGNQTTYTVFGLADDRMYCFAVTAYDTTKTRESAFSNEVAVLPTTLSFIDRVTPPDDVVLATAWECR